MHDSGWASTAGLSQTIDRYFPERYMDFTGNPNHFQSFTVLSIVRDQCLPDGGIPRFLASLSSDVQLVPFSLTISDPFSWSNLRNFRGHSGGSKNSLSFLSIPLKARLHRKTPLFSHLRWIRIPLATNSLTKTKLKWLRFDFPNQPYHSE